MIFNIAIACGVLSLMEAGLLDKYGERLLAVGVISNQVTVQWYVDPTDRSWTMLGVRPDKIACIIMGGEKFETTKNKSGKDM